MSSQKAVCFQFKIFILSSILPPFGLCCPGRPYHSPHPNYAPDCHNPELCTFVRLNVWTSQSYKFGLLGMSAKRLRRANISSVLCVLSVHMEKSDSFSPVFTKYLMRICIEICHTHRILFISIRVTDILHKYICKYLVITGWVLLGVVEVQSIIVEEVGTYGFIYIYKSKVHFTLEQAAKTQRGSRGIALLFP